MDDNIKNEPVQPESSGSPSSPQPASTPSSAPTQPSSPPVFETVPVEDSLQPEELPPEVVSPVNQEGDQAPPPETPPPLVETEGMQSKWPILGVIIIILLITVVFIFKIVFRGKRETKPVKLTYWGLWEEKEIFEPLIQQYKKNHPAVSIEYQKMAPQEYKDRLLARSVKGMGPDIFRFHNTWLPQIKEVVSPLPDQVMTAAEFEKTFYKIHQQDLKIDRNYYGIPLMIDGLVLIVNDGLLKKAGVEAIPTNWDEMTEVITKLTVKDPTGQIITAGLAVGTATNVEHFSDIFGLMLLQNGGSLKNLDKPEAAGALESYRKFAEPPNDFWNDLMPNSITAFAQEKVAMIIAPSWEILTIKSINPDLVLKVTPVPMVPGGKPVSLASYWVEGVSRFSKNQLEAWKFLRFLVEKDSLTKLYQIQSQVRLFGEAYSRVDLASLLAQNQYLGAVIKQAENFVSLPLASRTYDNGLNDEIIKYLENAINATSQGVSYSQALETAKKGVDQVFEKYGIQ